MLKPFVVWFYAGPFRSAFTVVSSGVGLLWLLSYPELTWALNSAYDCVCGSALPTEKDPGSLFFRRIITRSLFPRTIDGSHLQAISSSLHDVYR